MEGVPVLVYLQSRATPSSKLNSEGWLADQLPPDVDLLTAAGFGGAYGPSRLGESFFLKCYLYRATLGVSSVLYSMQACVRHKRDPTESLCFTTQDEQ